MSNDNFTTGTGAGDPKDPAREDEQGRITLVGNEEIAILPFYIPKFQIQGAVETFQTTLCPSLRKTWIAECPGGEPVKTKENIVSENSGVETTNISFINDSRGDYPMDTGKMSLLRPGKRYYLHVQNIGCEEESSSFLTLWRMTKYGNIEIDDPGDPDEPDLSVPELRTQDIRLSPGSTYTARFTTKDSEYFQFSCAVNPGDQSGGPSAPPPNDLIIWLSRTPNSRSDIVQLADRNGQARSGPKRTGEGAPRLFATSDRNHSPPDRFENQPVQLKGYAFLEPGETYYLNIEILSSANRISYTIRFRRYIGDSWVDPRGLV